MRYVVPNLFSSFNVILGAIGIYFCYDGRVEIGCFIILIASVLDFLDGLIARGIGGVSPFGKELDSLADMVVFGVLPGSILLTFGKNVIDDWLTFLGVIPILTAALRLAWFNVSGSGKNYFIGVPTPATAILISSLFLVFLFELKVNIYEKNILHHWLSLEHQLNKGLLPFVVLLDLLCNPYFFALFCFIVGALNLIPISFVKISPSISLSKRSTIILCAWLIFMLFSIFYWKLIFSALFYTLIFYLLFPVFGKVKTSIH